MISGNYSGYNGYYNYFNIGAYTTSSASATVNGLIYAKNNDWNSIYKSINGGAGIVGNNYVKKGQNTLYFQKFNVVNMNSIYSHQYMTNVQAAIGVAQMELLEEFIKRKNKNYIYDFSWFGFSFYGIKYDV